MQPPSTQPPSKTNKPLHESALLSADELNKLISIKDPFIKLIDATYVLPGSDYQPKEIFQRKRIDSARFFDIDEIADPNTDLPHMLPSPQLFAQKIGEMGITEDHHVIIYGQENILMGPARVWWMFRVFGQKQVSVLNVNLKVWEKNIYPIRRCKPLEHDKVEYRPNLKESLVTDINAVEAISASQVVPIYDARPAERFKGTAPEPRPNLPSGNIPGSINIPATSLINPDTGGLKHPSEYQHMFSLALHNSQKNPITTCGSGITACLLSLAMYELGLTESRVYDGSWAEWAQKHPPGEQGQQVQAEDQTRTDRPNDGTPPMPPPLPEEAPPQ